MRTWKISKHNKDGILSLPAQFERVIDILKEKEFNYNYASTVVDFQAWLRFWEKGI